MYLYSTVDVLVSVSTYVTLKNIAVLGLSCVTWDLLLQCTGSLVVANGLSWPIAHGILVPQPRVEPCPPHCKQDS